MKNKIKDITLSLAIILIILPAITLADQVLKKPTIYKVMPKIIVDGKVVFHPVMLVKENQKALLIVSDVKKTKTVRIEIKAMQPDQSKFKDDIEVNSDIEYKETNYSFHSSLKSILTPNHEITLSGFKSIPIMSSKLSKDSNSIQSSELRMAAAKME